MYKKIYSLRVHLELEKQGFKALLTMPNPEYPQYNCWIYEATPELLEAFIQLKGAGKGGSANG